MMHDTMLRILGGVPLPVFTLGRDFLIRNANDQFARLSRKSTPGAVEGLRLGNALACEKTREGKICGSSYLCRLCGVTRVFDEAWKHGKAQVTQELLTRPAGKLEALDLHVTVTKIDDDEIMAVIEDRSDHNRRALMERAFLHDNRNTLSNVCGLAEFLRDEDDIVQIRRGLHDIQREALSAVEEMRSYTDLVFAEGGVLQVNSNRFGIRELIDAVTRNLQANPQVPQRPVSVSIVSDVPAIVSDFTLLKRVLTNMLINACEAKSTTSVKIAVTLDQNLAVVSVANEGEIPPEVQLNIFNRFYSTKGTGRGIGTYSMKLLVEDYLGGDVAFSSDAEHGTVFSFRIPVGS